MSVFDKGEKSEKHAVLEQSLKIENSREFKIGCVCGRHGKSKAKKTKAAIRTNICLGEGWEMDNSK